MPVAGHHQEIEVLRCQAEAPFSLELAHESGRTRPVVSILSLMAPLRIVQQSEQVRHARGNAKLACQSTAMKCHPRPMARAMDSIPVESKRLPDPTGQTRRQAGWYVD